MKNLSELSIAELVALLTCFPFKTEKWEQVNREIGKRILQINFDK